MGHQSLHIQILAAIEETAPFVRWILNVSVNVSEGTGPALEEVLWGVRTMGITFLQSQIDRCAAVLSSAYSAFHSCSEYTVPHIPFQNASISVSVTCMLAKFKDQGACQLIQSMHFVE